MPNKLLLTEKLLAWYARNARVLPFRQNPTPYTTWISEIMLQQTRMNAVLPYYERFLAAFPDVFALAAAPLEQVLKLWEGLGYYSRAKNLHKAAKIIVEKYNGGFPRDKKALLALPGIGDYTAGAILSIACRVPCPAVDGNVLRVLARLCNDEREIDLPEVKRDAERFLASVLTEENCSALTQAVMEFGALVCVPGKPRCVECPLADLCEGRKARAEETLPRKKPKKPRRIEEKTMFIVECAGKTALIQGGKGVLAGLWQFPSAPGRLDADGARKALLALLPGLGEGDILSFSDLGGYTHVFTHVEWHMVGFSAVVASETGGFFWADEEAMETQVALPSAVRPFWERRAQTSL